MEENLSFKERIIQVGIEDEMKNSYLDYAMSVIVGRALPEIKDGLKPVHRRILYGMLELGVESWKPFKKSARIVGEVMGKYHPHGDAAIYDSIARMAQSFSLRYPLIDGQGNFGSIDGDPPAAMRYTEARLSPLAMEILADIEKETVDFLPNFDESLMEPSILPSKVPNLLINGSSGIAVGMATNIPPHNITEVSNALINVLKKPDISLEEIIQVLPAPDFPTGGTICGKQGIYEAYKTGKGIIILRGRIKIEEENSHTSLVITEIPYEVNKSTLVENIAALVDEKKIVGISAVRDESDKEGMRIVLEVKKWENTDIIINQLYRHTQLQTSYGIINLALVNKQPKLLPLKDTLLLFIEHRREIITKRTQYDLRKAEERHHILSGLKIAVDNMDKVIKLIRGSSEVEEARTLLQKEFRLTEKQANAILEMPLGRLTKLEREKIEKEVREIEKKISELKSILASKKKIDTLIEEELEYLKKKFGDERRTEIAEEIREMSEIDFIRPEDIVVTISYHGYIKRLPLETYRRQRRGGKGIIGVQTKEEDFVKHSFTCSTTDQLLIFTETGRVHWLKAYLLPEATRIARGKPLVNLLKIPPEEKIASVITINEFLSDKSLLMFTKKGIVKKTKLISYSHPRQAGIIGINLKPGDRLIDVKLTDGNNDVMLFTKYGMCIRFSEKQAREIGRTGMGVIGIRFKKANDEVISGEVFPSENPVGDILSVSSHGIGKRSFLKFYRTQKRAGKGIIDLKITKKTGTLVKTMIVGDNEEEFIIQTKNGQTIRMPVEDIRKIGRNTQGVRLIKLDEGDEIADIAPAPVRAETEEEKP
ncbi:MAG: DNA gyrase subunit A [Candidatus Omnitrophica bacterium]|nr:DNA gyrase subunit A [Candidatus Omnitrophota bacterium]